MLINAGLIPWYMTIKSVHLLGTIWALVLPGAVPVFSVVLMLNFFRAIPEELEEAAFMDGAGHWNIMARIYVPLSKASIATICLFALVYHWNSWFDGIILMNKPTPVSYTHLDVYKRQGLYNRPYVTTICSLCIY